MLTGRLAEALIALVGFFFQAETFTYDVLDRASVDALHKHSGRRTPNLLPIRPLLYSTNLWP